MRTYLGHNVDYFFDGKTKYLLIFGFAGSGKTTLSEKLSVKYRLDIIHCDDFYGSYKEETKNPREFWANYYGRLFDAIHNKENVIIEGNGILDLVYNRPKKYSFILIDTPIFKSTITKAKEGGGKYKNRFLDFFRLYNLNSQLGRKLEVLKINCNGSLTNFKYDFGV